MTNLEERTEKLYDAIALQYNEAFPVNFHPEHLKLFTEKLTPDAKILDAGCAGGRDTKSLCDQGFIATGIDFSSGQITVAKEKYPGVDFRKVDILKLDETFPAGEFDGVYCYATLDHLKKRNIPIAIANFNKVLKPGGVLLVCSRKGKGVLWTEDKNSSGKKRPFRLMTSEEFIQTLERKKFAIEYFESFPSLTRPNMKFNLALCRKTINI